MFGMTRDEPMTLSNIGGGAAEEKFQDELQKVLDNIVDLNAEITTVREITLTFKFKPDDNRKISGISIQGKAKLAPAKEFLSQCVVGSSNGKGMAREMANEQDLFPPAPKHKPEQPEGEEDSETTTSDKVRQISSSQSPGY